MEARLENQCLHSSEIKCHPFSLRCVGVVYSLPLYIRGNAFSTYIKLGPLEAQYSTSNSTRRMSFWKRVQAKKMEEVKEEGTKTVKICLALLDFIRTLFQSLAPIFPNNSSSLLPPLPRLLSLFFQFLQVSIGAPLRTDPNLPNRIIYERVGYFLRFT